MTHTCVAFFHSQALCLLIYLSFPSSILGPQSSTSHTFDWDSAYMTMTFVANLLPREGQEDASWVPSHTWEALWGTVIRLLGDWGFQGSFTYLSESNHLLDSLWLVLAGLGSLQSSGRFCVSRSCQPLFCIIHDSSSPCDPVCWQEGSRMLPAWASWYITISVLVAPKPGPEEEAKWQRVWLYLCLLKSTFEH